MSIYINLNDEEEKLLEECAREERRTAQQQAAYLVVTCLRQRQALQGLSAQMGEPMSGYVQRSVPVFPAGCVAGEEPS